MAAMPGDIFELNPAQLSNRTWVIQSCIQFFDRPNRKIGRHSFLQLSDDTDPNNRIVLDQLHFQAEGYVDGTPVKKQHRDVSNVFLRCSSYLCPLEKTQALVRYDSGAPLTMLGIWNSACDASVRINERRKPFDKDYNCRSGTKAVLKTLGHCFDRHDKQIGKETSDLLFGEIAPSSYAGSDDPLDLMSVHQHLHKSLLRTEKLKPQETAARF